MLNLNSGLIDLKKQIPKNISMNIIFFLINILIGIYLVPYYIDKLGVASYALIPLATSITSYVGLVTDSLSTSVSRYLTVDLQRKNFEKANVIFNTALFGMLGIALLSIPLIIFVSYFAPPFFKVPDSQINDASMLLLGTLISFYISTISGVVGVSLFAYNRLDIQCFLKIVNLLVRVVVILLLFFEFDPKLSHIGLANIIASISVFMMTVYFSKKINPHQKSSFSYFKLSKLKDIASTGNWLVVNQIGSLLFLQIDLIVVNKLFGTAAGGEYGALLVWSQLLRSTAGLLAGVLTPIIFTYYATNQFDKMIATSKSSVKFMGILMAIPIGCLCGFAPQILSIWIGSEFSRLSPLMWVLLGHLIINLSVLPLFPINVSFNKVRIPGLVTLFMGAGNFVLAIIIPYITGWGYYGVAIAGAIMLTLKNSLFIPWYATKVLGVSKNTFYKSMLPGIISMLLIACVTVIINYLINISSLFSLVSVCLGITIVYLSIVWTLGLSISEHEAIKSFIPFKLGG
ncbi:lipopolysaccharide biosynthesis protein [Methanosarcina mazei]|uniref:Polysaccharide biosynthesis protein n=1 Tax=Methanosarcina mazei TaxID=2209 RepID=A0A0F8IDA0_METMZ|nr:polysaccharide biosynthesis protein [Methanosarcina mazei]KKG75444.1 polysaccharide biosynthesis protein [Methanosarcina mazei]KKG77429.1 polysaccharide biosynthesis protein [Methanosarcina mazei]KKH06685.1 polysaccharide biosynthesis protein [Methanosarcina mazei]KKH07825.1 polysaccharide biosynthesis protein [Methanosarcina mazei]